MLLTVEAWRLRQAAREALGSAAIDRALRLAIEAHVIQATGSGDALRLLTAWLQASRGLETGPALGAGLTDS